MLTDDLTTRLERLNRERFLPAVLGAAIHKPEAPRHRPEAPPHKPEAPAREYHGAPSLALRASVGSEQCELDESADLSLAALAPGEERENGSGRHYVIARPLATFDADFAARLAGAAEFLRGTAASVERHPELAALIARFPRGTLFLDLETCGFAGSPIFLVGLLRHDGRGIVLEQLLARDYTEERSALESLWARVSGNRVLVTFNGKSFDWPMVRDRSTYHRLDVRSSLAPSDEGFRGDGPRSDASDEPSPHESPHSELLHCDLLHHARRRWRSRLPNCRLQTLERFVCRRLRRDDIAGSQIPQEYHQFVRTGDARAMRSILEHNALDLLTLAELALRVAA